MKIRNIFCLFLSIVLLTAVCSCSNSDTKPNEYTPPEARKVTVTDSDGAQVTTSDTNSGIISLGYQSTSLLIALGAKGLICGVDTSSANSALITKAFPEISNVAVVTDSENKVIAENVTAQNPGLVILTGECGQYAKDLREVGLTVAVVRFDSVEQIKASVELIGKLSNTEQKAAELSGFYDSALTRLKVMTATETKASVTIYDEDVVIRELVSNLNCDIVQSGEYVIAKSPDAPVGAIIAPHKLESWDEPSVSLILGLYWYAHNIFPQVISLEEVSQKAINFYADFYGITVTAGDLGIEIDLQS